MKSKILASSALALVLSTGAAFAAGPIAEITDTGDRNTSYIEQKAGSTDSAALIEQAGSKNKQSSSSRSFSPSYSYGAAIVQDGASDTGHIKQSGHYSNAYIEQAGANNAGRDGYAYGGEIVQAYGSNNEAYVSQTGDRHIAYVFQGGSDEMARIIQTGLRDTASVTQSGSLDFADVHQGGEWNSSEVKQLGSFDRASIDQYANGGTAKVFQNDLVWGVNNEAHVMQSSNNGAIALISQNGSNGVATVNQ